jgi:hypothetical protein
MRTTAPRLFKPPVGTQLDRSSPLARGLIWFAPFWEAAGNSVADVVGGNGLTNAGGVWEPGPLTIGLYFGASDYAQVAAPASLQINYPMSFVVAFQRYTGNLGAQPLLCWQNSTQTFRLGISVGATNTLRSTTMSGSTLNTTNYSYTIPSNVDQVVGLSITSTTVVVYVYSGGSLQFTQTNSISSSAPTYLSPADFGCGTVGAGSGTPNSLIYWGGFWSRALAASEFAQFNSVNSAWQIFAPPLPVAWWAYKPPVVAASNAIFFGAVA